MAGLNKQWGTKTPSLWRQHIRDRERDNDNNKSLSAVHQQKSISYSGTVNLPRVGFSCSSGSLVSASAVFVSQIVYNDHFSVAEKNPEPKFCFIHSDCNYGKKDYASHCTYFNSLLTPLSSWHTYQCFVISVRTSYLWPWQCFVLSVRILYDAQLEVELRSFLHSYLGQSSPNGCFLLAYTHFRSSWVPLKGQGWGSTGRLFFGRKRVNLNPKNKPNNNNKRILGRVWRGLKITLLYRRN